MQPIILWPTWLATRMFLFLLQPMYTYIYVYIYLYLLGITCSVQTQSSVGQLLSFFFLWWFFLCFYILLFNLPFYYFIILFTAFVQILFKNKNSYIDILNFSFNMGMLVIQIYFYTYSQIVLLIYLTVEQKIKSTILKL